MADLNRGKRDGGLKQREEQPRSDTIGGKPFG
jgi:hypothetical protein